MGKKEKKSKPKATPRNDIFEKSANKKKNASTSSKTDRQKKKEAVSKRGNASIYILSILVAILSVLIFFLLQRAMTPETHVRPQFRVLVDEEMTDVSVNKEQPTMVEDTEKELTEATSSVEESKHADNNKVISPETPTNVDKLSPEDVLEKTFEDDGKDKSHAESADSEGEMKDKPDSSDDLKQDLDTPEDKINDESIEPENESVEIIAENADEKDTSSLPIEDGSDLIQTDIREENVEVAELVAEEVEEEVVVDEPLSSSINEEGKPDDGQKYIKYDERDQEKTSLSDEVGEAYDGEAAEEVIEENGAKSESESNSDDDTSFPNSAEIMKNTLNDSLSDDVASDVHLEENALLDDKESPDLEPVTETIEHSHPEDVGADDSLDEIDQENILLSNDVEEAHDESTADEMIEEDEANVESGSDSDDNISLPNPEDDSLSDDVSSGIDLEENALLGDKESFNSEPVTESIKHHPEDIVDATDDSSQNDESEFEEDEYDDRADEDDEDEDKFDDDEGFTEISSGVRKKVIKHGNGYPIELGDTITIQCVGYLDVNPPKKFWSTKDPAQRPFTFAVGKRQVIKGWDEGAKSMRLNERSRIKIEPSKAYGKFGFEAWGIPPDASIIFEMEVVEHKRLKKG